MKTSRIARETARLSQKLSQGDTISTRQTSPFASSLNAFAANDTPAKQSPLDVKQEDLSDSSSVLSSIQSVASFDIEDAVLNIHSPRKRKRSPESPSTIVASTSLTQRIRTSPRKASARNNVKKARPRPAKRVVNDQGKVEFHAPVNWQEIYEGVKEMRKTVLAPVDTMGCETLAEDHLTPRVCWAYTRPVFRI